MYICIYVCMYVSNVSIFHSVAMLTVVTLIESYYTLLSNFPPLCSNFSYTLSQYFLQCVMVSV